MKKILVILLLVSSSMFSKEILLTKEYLETPIYNSNTIIYYCIDGYVEAEFKDIVTDKESRIPVVWSNEGKNKVTKLRCEDYAKWTLANSERVEDGN